MTTIVLILLTTLTATVNVALWTLLLWVGLRWMRAEGVSATRVIAAVALMFLAYLASLAAYALAVSALGAWAGVAVAMLLVTAQWIVIKRMFHLTLWRAAAAWLPTMALVVVSLALALPIRLFLYEAFTMPTNSMAPTLVGRHWQGSCTLCEARAYCSVPESGGQQASMICDNFHVTYPPQTDDKVYQGDRFLVAKFLRPRRWDLVVFRYPQDPSVFYCMRLIGLPGEVITLREGRVWINGQPAAPPEALAGITYLSQIEGFPFELWGSLQKPAKLGADEYFVLGDFSAVSADSRFWQANPDGRHPYAVPESHIVGVATHIYWPPGRCRVFR